MCSSGVGAVQQQPLPEAKQMPHEAAFVQQFNQWAFKRIEHSRYSGMEGEVFKAWRSEVFSASPLVLLEGQTIAVHLGSGLFIGGGRGRLHCSDRRQASTSGSDTEGGPLEASSASSVFSYTLRPPPICHIKGPATAAEMLRELTTAAQREVARNLVLCTALDVVSSLSRDVSSAEELEQVIDQQPPNLTDADGLLPVPLSREQLKQLARYMHTGPGFPDLDHARELSLSPDPCSELTSQQSKEAVRMAWSKGTTFFEGLEPYDAHTHKDVQAPDDLLCPLYVVKWSQPYC